MSTSNNNIQSFRYKGTEGQGTSVISPNTNQGICHGGDDSWPVNIMLLEAQFLNTQLLLCCLNI